MFASWRRVIDQQAASAQADDLRGYRPYTQRRPTWRIVKFPDPQGVAHWDHLPVVGYDGDRELVIWRRRLYAITTTAEYNDQGTGHVRVAIAMVRRLQGAA